MRGREAMLGLLHVTRCTKGPVSREGVHTYALVQRYNIVLLHVYILYLI